MTEDEVITTSTLYPEVGFFGDPSLGAISGTVFNTNETTPVSGVNVVVRRIDQGSFPPPAGTEAFPGGIPSVDINGVPLPPLPDPATDSLAKAFNVVSGRVGPGFVPGPSITPGNGTFRIDGLLPGNYLVGIESIDDSFVGESSVGQFDPPLQLIIEESYNGANESSDPQMDNQREFIPVTVTAGRTTTGVHFILNRLLSANDIEPNNTLAQANPITLSVTVSGSVNPITEVDLFSFTGNEGDVVAINVRARRLSPPSALDPIVDLLNSSRAILASNDDFFGFDCFLQFRLPSTETFFVRLRSFAGASAGPYQADISRKNPIPQIFTPVIAVDPASQNFGNVLVGGFTEKTFAVRNIGGGVLTGIASTNPPFRIVSEGSYSLGAGQSRIVTVRFSPTSPGAFVGNVNFAGGGGARRVVSGTGVVPANFSAFTFDGKLRDRVGQGGSAYAPDGANDGTFTVTLDPSSGNRTVTRLMLTRTGGGGWDSTPSFWALGTARTINDTTLLNSGPSGSVNFPLNAGDSFVVFASDQNNALFTPNTKFILTANFADGTTPSSSTTIPGSRIRFFNNLIRAPSTTVVARLTDSQGHTWRSLSGTFSPYQPVAELSLGPFSVFDETFNVLIPNFPCCFNVQHGRQYLIVLDLSGPSTLILGLIDEGPIPLSVPSLPRSNSLQIQQLLQTKQISSLKRELAQNGSFARLYIDTNSK